ncbi:hypothetical protein, partial [Xenorhabdus sp. BG5]|uniref:hypothetical protein n=1 Tax=Xenorhabdus sp. BG5 TaxID=2782014 RepID=UPI001D152A9B
NSVSRSNIFVLITEVISHPSSLLINIWLNSSPYLNYQPITFNQLTGVTIVHPTDAHCSDGVEYEDERKS